jgi:hypothetical protein
MNRRPAFILLIMKITEKTPTRYNLAKAGKKDEKNNPSYLFA